MRHRAGTALLLLVAAGPVAAWAQTTTFSTRVEMVRVDVLVTDGHHPVRGLGRDDFEVLDNGVPQQLELVLFEELPLNVVLVLDTSQSLAGERLEHLRQAGHGVLDALTPDDQAALVRFDHVVRFGAGLTHDLGQLRATLEQAEASGSTAVADAAYAAMMLGESDVGRALVIIFSDGIDTSSFLAPEAVADIARRSDVVVYAVSIDRPKDAAFLHDLTKVTGGRLFDVASTRDLPKVFLGILDEFRQRYLLSFSPRGVSKDGWHKIEVRVKKRSLKVQARPGYLAGPAPVSDVGAGFSRPAQRPAPVSDVGAGFSRPAQRPAPVSDVGAGFSRPAQRPAPI